LERGNSTSLPKTSGSLETDELLQTLHRNNQQLQNLVGLMDKVSSGNVDVALTPLEQSDRLSNAFQKLLARVTESINAQQNLEQLKNSVRQMNEIAAQIKSGNFDLEINSEDAATEEISDALRFLTRRLNEIT
ncbi:hypothetical protein M1S01_27330, partial [Klebsiella pneumoniae]|uniref:hypothetical protein n=1 Tax=Klebsiella pneumoniae TaxID=573 RepID=UPI002553D11C